MLSLLRLEHKQKNSSNPFRIRIFLFLSYSFRIAMIRTFVHSCSSLKSHTRFQTKMSKVNTRFQTKTAQKAYPMGSTYLYSYIREYPPPPPGLNFASGCLHVSYGSICLGPARRLPRPSWSVHFGDVSETNGRTRTT